MSFSNIYEQILLLWNKGEIQSYATFSHRKREQCCPTQSRLHEHTNRQASVIPKLHQHTVKGTLHHSRRAVIKTNAMAYSFWKSYMCSRDNIDNIDIERLAISLAKYMMSLVYNVYKSWLYLNSQLCIWTRHARNNCKFSFAALKSYECIVNTSTKKFVKPVGESIFLSDERKKLYTAFKHMTSEFHLVDFIKILLENISATTEYQSYSRLSL